MSTSTVPKYVLAQAGSNDSGHSSSANPRDRIQRCRAFLDQYKTLPNDFLRVPSSYYPDTQLAMPPQVRLPREATLVDMLEISVIEAVLAKNYGLLRMDLYCRIRVGHMVCESGTSLNGAKNPKWHGIYQFTLKPGIDSFHIEVYDEKQFSSDEKIAWLSEPIPPEVFQGITVERWFPLTGRLGTNKEGSILLVLSHKRVPYGAPVGPAPTNVIIPANIQLPGNGGPIVVSRNPNRRLDPYSVETTTSPPEVIIANESYIEQLSEMFPSIDKAVIKSVLENNQNNKEAAIETLLAMG